MVAWIEMSCFRASVLEQDLHVVRAEDGVTVPLISRSGAEERYGEGAKFSYWLIVRTTSEVGR
jgi:hypothetical protein